MTTASNYVAKTIARLNQMIHPAKVRDLPANRQLLMGVCAELHLSNPTTIEEAAAQFRRAVITLSNDPGRWDFRVWDVEPATIQRFKPEQVENTRKTAEGQAKALKEADARKEHEKRQKAGEQRALNLVNAFHPVSYRGTEHMIMADTKKLLFDYIAKNKARNADMEDVANKVAAHIAAEYEKVERMGVNSR